jgi:hypothetical protein
MHADPIECSVGLGSKVNAGVGSRTRRREEWLFSRSMLKEPMSGLSAGLHLWMSFLQENPTADYAQ